MIFSIQSYLENYFNRCGLVDPDQYAVNLAALYDRERHRKTNSAFLSTMRRMRTVFYRRNQNTQRAVFEKRILQLLDSKFKKKRLFFVPNRVAARVEASGKRLAKRPRISIRQFLEEFKKTIEAEAVNSFWESRKTGKLKRRPEKLGQEFLAVFANAKLAGRGSAIREAVSGIGFVDVLITFSSGLLHVVELKMLKGAGVPGPAQLATYMKHKKRVEGWLVLFDARKQNRKSPVPPTFKKASGAIKTIVIDINPVPPHDL